MRICPVCGSELKGRSDQIYCSTNCKSAAQYENRYIKDETFYKIDRQLRTNRKILKKYNQDGFTTIQSQILLNEGFNPNFFTHFWRNAKNQPYLFCFEFGFRSVTQKNKEKYLLIKWQDYMSSTKHPI